MCELDGFSLRRSHIEIKLLLALCVCGFPYYKEMLCYVLKP